jgi:hypothetical protein
MKTASVLLILGHLLIQGCVYIPKTKPEDLVYGDCTTYTRKWELTHKQYVDFEVCYGSSPIESGICLSLIGVVVPAGSFIVSGSVVIVGNTLNWLEYKGRCGDEAIDGDLPDAIEFIDDKLIN